MIRAQFLLRSMVETLGESFGGFFILACVFLLSLCILEVLEHRLAGSIR